MADKLTDKKRSWLMSRVRGKNTKPEMVVRRYLHARGFRYRLHVKGLPGSPDLVLPKYKTAIFIHGCFWHRHADCSKASMPKTRLEFWQGKFDANVVRDDANERQLTGEGWKVITVWECELTPKRAQATLPLLVTSIVS